MVINCRTYADFKSICLSISPDFVGYIPSIEIAFVGAHYGVAYAFDYVKGVCVTLQLFNGITLSLADFPSAVELSEELLVQDASALSAVF
jgi:hypothetical protein